jgi:hypothetical protein
MSNSEIAELISATVSERGERKIPRIISEGGIDHALVIAAFWWLAQARPERFTP